jgi:hypothetical protein
MLDVSCFTQTLTVPKTYYAKLWAFCNFQRRFHVLGIKHFAEVILCETQKCLTDAFLSNVY